MNPVLTAVGAALLVALTAIGIASGEEESARPSAAQGRGGPSVRQVVRGVERVRELQFDHLPRVRDVSAAEARRAGLRDIERNMPRRQLELEERLYKMLGLLPPDASLRELIGKALGGEVAGYYVASSDTLALVRDAGLGGLFAEVTMAHELTHALEDQRFGLEPHAASGFLRDRGDAEAALAEGSATLVMVDYLAETRGAGGALPPELRSRLLDRLDDLTVPAPSDLPRYVREALVFPYAAGAPFVDRIQQRGGWAAVDRVYERGGPVSTEQVMHPAKYDRHERPARVRLGDYRDALPAGARVVYRGDLGEFDTAQFLRDENGRRRAEEAAAGWRGAAFALWRLPQGGDALVVGWAWDTARDAAEFEEAARRSLPGLGMPGAVHRGRSLVDVVLAPEASTARRVARRVGRWKAVSAPADGGGARSPSR